MAGPFDPPYGAPPGAVDPFGGPQPIEEADPLAPSMPAPEADKPWSWVPDSWLQAAPADHMPDPLGLTPRARAAAEAVQPTAPSSPAEAKPPGLTTLSTPDEPQWPEWLGGVPRTIEQLAKPAQPLETSLVQWPEALGGPAPQPAPDAITGAAPVVPGEPPPPPTWFEGFQQQLGGALNQPTPTLQDILKIEDPDARYAAVMALPEGKRKQVLAQLPEEEFQRVYQQHEDDRKSLVEAQRISAGVAAKRAAEDDAKAYEAGLAARQRELDNLNAESIRLGKQRIDDNHWFSSGGVGRTIASFVLGIVGGFMQSKTGGRNLGLEWIDKRIDQDLETQKANLQLGRASLDQRRGILAEQLRQGKDLNEAMRVAKIASYDRVLGELDAQAQQFDPRGTQALNAERSRRQWLAARNELLLKHLEATRKTAEDAAKLELERQRLTEQKWKNRSDASIDWTKVTDERKSKARQFELEEKKIEAEQEKEKRKVEREEADKDEKYGLAGPNATALDAKGNVQFNAQGQPRVHRGMKLKQEDGSAFRITDDTLHREAVSKMHAAINIVDIIDRVAAIRDKVGGESSLANSKEFQQLKVLEPRLVMLIKGGTQGMSSDADFENLRAAVGARDLTSFRDRAGGLEEARQRTLSELNSFLTTNGYDGPAIDIKNHYLTRAPEKTLEEEHQQRLFEKPNVSIEAAESQSLQAIRAATPKDSADEKGWKAETHRQMLAEAKKRGAEYKDIAPDQRRELERMGRLATGSSEQAQAARRTLADVAQRGGTARIREEAQGYLNSAGMADSSSKEQLPEARSSSVAREGAP